MLLGGHKIPGLEVLGEVTQAVPGCPCTLEVVRSCLTGGSSWPHLVSQSSSGMVLVLVLLSKCCLSVSWGRGRVWTSPCTRGTVSLIVLPQCAFPPPPSHILLQGHRVSPRHQCLCPDFCCDLLWGFCTGVEDSPPKSKLHPCGSVETLASVRGCCHMLTGSSGQVTGDARLQDVQVTGTWEALIRPQLCSRSGNSGMGPVSVRSGCCDKVLHTGWLQQPKFVFSGSWSPEVQGQGVLGVL